MGGWATTVWSVCHDGLLYWLRHLYMYAVNQDEHQRRSGIRHYTAVFLLTLSRMIQSVISFPSHIVWMICIHPPLIWVFTWLLGFDTYHPIVLRAGGSLITHHTPRRLISSSRGVRLFVLIILPVLIYKGDTRHCLIVCASAQSQIFKTIGWLGACRARAHIFVGDVCVHRYRPDPKFENKERQ